MGVGFQYRAYLTPLVSAFTYGAEIDISDLVENAAGSIDRSIDSTDFSVGIYVFSDVQITCDNAQGLLSDISDSRSYFTYQRNLAKVRLVIDPGNGNPSTTYKGVINDDATQVNSDTDEIVVTLQGPDSVLKSSLVSAGAITGGMTVQQALVAILNTSDVRSVLGIQLSNLNPANNITIDDGTKFDNVDKQTAITNLLAASDSVMLIDSDYNVIVRDRGPNYANRIWYLYGHGNLGAGTENIQSIQNYNTGLQRTFNSVIVTGGQASTTVSGTAVSQPAQTGVANDTTSQGIYGPRQKKLSLDFITQQSTLQAIAQGYVDEFSYPKIELEVTVPTNDVVGIQLLDQVSIDYPLLTTTPDGKHLPVIGVAVIGDPLTPLPYTKGAISIDPSVGFKVIEITEDISAYTTVLKIRQVGNNRTDGGLVVPINVTVVTNAMSPYQITTSNDWILLDCNAGPVTVVAPAPQSLPQKQYTVLKKDSTGNAGTLQHYASEDFISDIGVSTSITLPTQGAAVEIASDLTNWYAAFNAAGGGGGGSSLVWELLSNAPTENDVSGCKVLDFDSSDSQGIWAQLQVPAGYESGVQITLVGGQFACSATTGNVKFDATTYLLRAGSTTLGTFSNSHASANAAVAVPGSASQLTSIGAVDLTDASGQINGISVQAGDVLLINLIRDTANEGTSAAADARFVRNSMVPQFA